MRFDGGIARPQQNVVEHRLAARLAQALQMRGTASVSLIGFGHILGREIALVGHITLLRPRVIRS